MTKPFSAKGSFFGDRFLLAVCFSVCLSAFFARPQMVQAADSLLINGAGATFPYPLYSKWFAEYRKVDPSVTINYQSIGSGGGIRQLLDETIDFGASDAPMTDEQLAKARSAVVHVPTVLGAVVVTYHLPDLKAPVRLTPALLADLFLGKISKWNDPKLQSVNPGVPLPDRPVTIAHRSDGSGTSAIFTDYLSKVSPEWKSRVGAGAAVKWPVGLGGKGNEGVTGLVKQTPGAIGYVEFIFAKSNGLPSASIQNSAGQFVQPSTESLTAVAEGALKDIPEDFRTSLTDAKGAKAYPIAGMTYLLVYKEMKGEKGVKFKKFLAWAVENGQSFAEPLHYARLPKPLAQRVKAKIAGIGTP